VGRTVRIAALALGAILVLVLLGAQIGLFSGTRPDNLGISGGRLAPCKTTPNCVSSQVDRAADPGHYIDPLRYTGAAEAAWQALRQAVRDSERTKIVREDGGYLYAEFTSRLMGFVDDVEFQLDPTGVIHVRSASRLGSSDFGVNRQRVEAIRVKLAAAGV
jgi:uncharacterized protein (DUF1499 family)